MHSETPPIQEQNEEQSDSYQSEYPETHDNSQSKQTETPIGEPEPINPLSRPQWFHHPVPGVMQEEIQEEVSRALQAQAEIAPEAPEIIGITKGTVNPKILISAQTRIEAAEKQLKEENPSFGIERDYHYGLEFQGHIELRKKLAQRYDTEIENIFMTTSVRPPIGLGLDAIAQIHLLKHIQETKRAQEEGKEAPVRRPIFVGHLSPGYFRHIDSLHDKAGANIVPIPIPYNENGFDLALMEDLFKNGLSGFLLSKSHINPIGTSIPDDNFKALCRLAAKYDVTLVLDEVYNEFGYTQTSDPFLKLNQLEKECAHEDKVPSIVLISGDSKTFRNNVAHMVTTNAQLAGKSLTTHISEAYANGSTHGGDYPAQAIMNKMMETGAYQQQIDLIHKENGLRMKLLHNCLKSYLPGEQIPEVQDGYFIGVHLKIKNFSAFQALLKESGIDIANNNNSYQSGGKKQVESPELIEYLKAQQDILLNTCDKNTRDQVYRASNPPHGRHLVRFGVMHLPPEQIEPAIAKFAELYHNQQIKLRPPSPRLPRSQ